MRYRMQQYPIKRLPCFFVVLIAATVACSDLLRAAEGWNVEVRPGVTIPAVSVIPKNPTAAMLLLPGGNGSIAISGRTMRSPDIFPQAIMDDLARQGIASAVIDLPSDKRGLSNLARQSRARMDELAKVITWLHNHVGKPVWVLGHSAGTMDTALIGIANPPQLAGIILSGSITDLEKNPSVAGKRTTEKNVHEMELEKIKIPALVIHHKMDACEITLPKGAPLIFERLTGSAKAELVYVDGGSEGNPRGGSARVNPCESFSYHMYNRYERQTGQQIISFVKANTK